jgi:hypothetical protein
MSFSRLSGKYLGAFNPDGNTGFNVAPGFNLDYTTKPPLGGDSTLPSSPEGPLAGGFNIGGINIDPKSLSGDQLLAYGMYRDQNDPQKQIELLKAYDEIQTKQADKMMKYGIQANLMGSLLKDLPKAMTTAAYQNARYVDDIARGPYAAARAVPTRFGSGANMSYFNV